MNIALVVAVAEDGTIGNKGGIPWKYKEDMQHFRSITAGGAIIMGRKTFESLPKLLEGRTHVVITQKARGAVKDEKGVWRCDSLNTAVGLCSGLGFLRTAIIGGRKPYAFALACDLVDVAHITRVPGKPDGDTKISLEPDGYLLSKLELAESREGEQGLVFETWRRKP